MPTSHSSCSRHSPVNHIYIIFKFFRIKGTKIFLKTVLGTKAGIYSAQVLLKLYLWIYTVLLFPQVLFLFDEEGRSKGQRLRYRLEPKDMHSRHLVAPTHDIGSGRL